ncbi:PREDICTED: amyloid beta A4 precursor protein-binding family B member 1-interacting protein-like, partial [Buceros rhinoceros silvestris]|uniref:amyloid beta A4 precursor protein-binding family B member 1-interacting protein-like n=1 Tax=Buceros rhinoceros silvestris TaxID=175836 RepID=UPI0005294816
ENFCGTSVIVPELEGALFLKEDGKKSWKRRYFLLRASGIYYVPKGKTKTSRDLACFIQFENMNVYYGSQHKVKYKAPTDHCFVLKHPQIQKESQYIKYLCCDDQATLHRWVTGIRIAKYGKTLYDNYKCAVKKVGLSSRWANQGMVEPAAPAGSSLSGAVQSNGQIPQVVRRSSVEFPETQKKVDTSEAKSMNVSAPGLMQPVMRPQKYQGKRNSLKPPPPPERRSSAISVSPVLPSKVKRDSGIYLTDPDSFPAPPPTLSSDLLPPPPTLNSDFPPPPPPPPSDFCEPPPDFVPPPPPTSSSGNGDLPLPPPPPPASNKPPPLTKKPVPLPSKRIENTGQDGDPRSAGPPPVGGGGRQADFMSDLMKALEKKRGSSS